MRPIIIILIVFFVRNSLQGVQLYNEEITKRSELVNAVLRPYLMHLSATWTGFVYARDPHILEKLSSTVPLILINDWDILTREMSGIIAENLVVIIDGNAADEDAYSDLERLRGVRTRQSVLVMCYGSVACNLDVNLKKIAESTKSPMLHYVVVDEGESVIQIYERTKTAEGSCGVSRLVRLPYNTSDAWLTKETFFLPVNFNKCPIRLATWNVLSKSRPCKATDSNYFCGLEGEIVKNVVDKINATPVTIVMTYGEVQNLVAMKGADLGYGHIHVDRNVTFTYSTWYTSIIATIIVPHSASDSEASLLTIALPLNRNVWIGFAVTISSMFILGRFVPYFRGLSALQQFSAIIGNAILIQHRRISQRIYFFSIVLFGFFFTQIYLVNLTKIYSSVSQPHLIKTLDEVGELGLSIYGGSSGKLLLSEFNYTRIAENNYKSDKSDPVMMRKSGTHLKVVDMQKHVTKIIEALSGQSSDPVFVEIDVEVIPAWKNVEVMKEIAGLYYLGLITPNSSSLMTVVDRVILKTLEGGIREKESSLGLTGEKAVTHAWLHGKSSLDSTKTPGPKKLTLKDLEGVFPLHVGGLVLSTLLFIVELAVGLFKAKLAARRRAGSPSVRPAQRTRVSGILLPARRTPRAGLVRRNANL